MLEAALDEGVPVVSVTGGNPAPFFEQLKGTNVKKLVLVAAVRQAVKAEELGADAVMVVGQEGAGISANTILARSSSFRKSLTPYRFRSSPQAASPMDAG